MLATATPDLITRIKNGDGADQNEWFSKNRSHLRRWTNFSLGVSPGHGGDASDVLQNVFLEMFQNISPRVQTEEQLLREVRTKLHRSAIDLARRRVLFSISSGPGGSSSVGGLGAAEPFAAGYTTSSLQITHREREDYILAETGNGEGDSPAVSDTGTALVRLGRTDEAPLKVFAGCLGVGCVDAARHHYAALRPLLAGIDRQAVDNWPPEQDTDWEKMFRALPGLTDQQRQFVELCHVERHAYEAYDREGGGYRRLDCRYSAREAGEVVRMTPAAVGTWVFRGRKRQSELLNQPRRPGGPAQRHRRPGQPAGEGAAREVLQAEERQPLVLADLVDLNDVRVL